MSSCEHSSLLYTPSPYAAVTGYKQAGKSQIAAKIATGRRSDRVHDTVNISEHQFPAPLILPDDSLALDEEEDEPQSFEEWSVAQYRNKVTNERNIIYVIPPPLNGNFEDESFSPLNGNSFGKTIPQPDTGFIRRYLEAFYDGLRVKIWKPKGFTFTSWDDDQDTIGNSSTTKEDAVLQYIGLIVNGSVTRIRKRGDPSKMFSCQLNVGDLLDAAMYMLPKNAYAMCMVVNHDLYESEEDLFICGRAYGGSRVAVVSSARYHPCLDQEQDVEREHAWPACHCLDYIMTQMPKKRRPGKKASSRKRKLQNDQEVVEGGQDSKSYIPNPLAMAVTAHRQHFTNAQELPGLWVSRLCRTVSHELGHCFGIGHCSSFACIMQASASISEDARQPPYLCPECLAKVLHATGSTKEKRYRALETCLDNLDQVNNSAMFRAFREWLRARTTDLT